jgi:tetratricopeptide (TPR) repeat protein
MLIVRSRRNERASAAVLAAGVVLALGCFACGDDPEPNGGAERDVAGEEGAQSRVARYTVELAENPNEPRVLSLLAEALVETGDYAAAAARLQEAARVDPDDPEVHFRLGSVLTEIGRTEEAIASYEESIALAASPDAHVLLGMLLADIGRNAEAVTHYESALVLDPASVDAHYNLGVELGKQGRHGDAAAHYRAALEQDPDHIEAANNLGAALFAQGKATEAIGYFERILRVDPTDVQARGNWAMALTAEGQVGEAIRVLEDGIARSPEAPALANQLAWLRAATPEERWRDGKEAVRLAELACALTKQQNPNYLDTLAAAYAEVGRFDDAVRTLGRAIALAEARQLPQFQERLALYEAGRPYRGQ